MKIAKSLLCAAALTTLVANMAPAQASNNCQLGFVDVQRAIDISKSGKFAVQKVRQDFEEKRQLIEQRKRDLAKMKETLDRVNPTQSEQERQRMQDDYNRQVRDLKQFIENSNVELENQERAYTNQIITELSTLIQDYGQKNNYCFIYELKTSGIIYGAKDRDMTDTIVNMYDEMKAKEGLGR
ncbi:OmpH family outer membrane protein [Chrysiogenes arsenatis]|uniref:OmpH family outer membrane protein n=1 Tax=Chrysiogenes arsenatis TaxID=309797 RepID=UPI000403DD61|nr:OmpH family outer membrane protein [Chrysiogenes arsenatis]